MEARSQSASKWCPVRAAYQETMIRRISRCSVRWRRHGRHTHYAVPGCPGLSLLLWRRAKYGEWIVLSATVSYLSNLNFGITTYASNELHHAAQARGDGQDCKLPRQHLALLLCMICVGLRFRQRLLSASAQVLHLSPSRPWKSF